MTKDEIREAQAEYAALSRREQKEPLLSAADRARLTELEEFLLAKNAF
jgi:hypothetical protein